MAGEPDPFDETAQDAEEQRKARFIALQRAREVDDFKWLMGHVQGRRVMWRLLDVTGLFRNPHVPGGASEDTAFRCGEQNVGQRFMADIHELTPEKYNVMVEEHQRWLKLQA